MKVGLINNTQDRLGTVLRSRGYDIQFEFDNISKNLEGFNASAYIVDLDYLIMFYQEGTDIDTVRADVKHLSNALESDSAFFFTAKNIILMHEGDTPNEDILYIMNYLSTQFLIKLTVIQYNSVAGLCKLLEGNTSEHKSEVKLYKVRKSSRNKKLSTLSKRDDAFTKLEESKRQIRLLGNTEVKISPHSSFSSPIPMEGLLEFAKRTTEVVCVTARSNSGKTSFTIGLAVSALKNNKKVVIIDTGSGSTDYAVSHNLSRNVIKCNQRLNVLKDTELSEKINIFDVGALEFNSRIIYLCELLRHLQHREDGLLIIIDTMYDLFKDGYAYFGAFVTKLVMTTPDTNIMLEQVDVLAKVNTTQAKVLSFYNPPMSYEEDTPRVIRDVLNKVINNHKNIFFLDGTFKGLDVSEGLYNMLFKGVVVQ